LFSEEGIDDLRRIFASADETGSGKILSSQLPSLFAELGFIVEEKVCFVWWLAIVISRAFCHH